VTTQLFLLRGAPGTGKSSIAQRLVRRIGGGVVVEVDHIRRMVPGIDWTDDLVHLEAISIAATTVEGFLARELHPVVFVDTLGYGQLEYALQLLETVPAKVLSLVCRDPVLSLRLLGRTSGYRDVRSARKFNAHILQDADRFPVIDTTWRSAASVAADILSLEGSCRT
jgi:broad-specificity NMP kinase